MRSIYGGTERPYAALLFIYIVFFNKIRRINNGLWYLNFRINRGGYNEILFFLLKLTNFFKVKKDIVKVSVWLGRSPWNLAGLFISNNKRKIWLYAGTSVFFEKLEFMWFYIKNKIDTYKCGQSAGKFLVTPQRLYAELPINKFRKKIESDLISNYKLEIGICK